MKRPYALLLVAFVLGLLAVNVRADEISLADHDFFEKKIRPLLSARCFSCHGNGKEKGGLRMSSRDSLLKGGDTGAAIVPGKPAQSLLIEAIEYKKDLKMPPKGKLSDKEIADLTTWVKKGAPWPATPSPTAASDSPLRQNGDVITAEERAFWSFQPVRNPPLPSVKNAAWPQRPLDYFILSQQEAKNLHPVAPANKRALLRRATFDLIGLPPTPEEVDAFVADSSPRAFETVIERLLSSPHYGERWARYWLDVARYAEDQAHTFQARLYPNGYRYRDWIAKALQSDMPYDRFIIEQIAGDLLPGGEGDREDRLAALGYFAMGPYYYDDAGEANKARADDLDDRIDTLSRGFLGLTVACARCHDHKFDPIPTKDYYSLAGVIQSSEYVETPIGPRDVIDRYNQAQARIKEQDEQIKKYLAMEGKRISDKMPGEIARYMVAAWKIQQQRKANSSLSINAVAKKENLRDFVLERWMQYLFDKAAETRPQLARWRQVLATLDASKNLADQPEAIAKVGAAAQAVQEHFLAVIKLRDALAQSHQTALANATEEVKKKLSPPTLDKAQADWLKELQGVFNVNPRQVEALLAEPEKKALAGLRAELDKFKKNMPPKYPFVHTLAEGKKPADMKIYVRGNVRKEGDVAPRRFLRILAGDEPPRFTQGSGRLELARAIASPTNPLTARVLVNRIWQHHFGKGLVGTPSNFGKLGQRPSHPELLDHLATLFVERGWSIKNLHREIMLSATYQLASDWDEHDGQIDPANQLLWRANRQRLDVEAWRDAFLAVSGNLDERLGGPPSDLGAAGNRRRTLYGSISRHNLNSLLRLFDFPDPNITSENRSVTIVPLQQLFVLNSPFMIEQAKALVQRLQTAAADDPTRIRQAFVRLYGRPASEQEVQLGMEYLSSPDSEAKLNRWEQYAQVLLSANEFMFVD